MNKVVTPKQLELTAGKTREELLIAKLPPHIDAESPAFKEDIKKVEKIEAAEAAGAVLGLSDEESEGDFDWDNPKEDSIILREQRATAAYRNRAGELIIRQRASWCDDHDTFVYITPENEVAFMEGLAKRARE
jgi:hypothetical protein